MNRVLFLYATRHSGHTHAADAVAAAMRAIDPGVQTTGIDFFTRHYPNLGPFIFRMYVDLMHSFPHLWDYLYDSPDVASVATELRRLLTLLNIPRLRALLRSAAPDAIVCTQAVPAAFLARERMRGTCIAPLFAVITDFVANPYWPAAHIDAYFVPHEEVRAQLIDRGIPAARIAATGIPVDASFARPRSPAAARARLRLAPDRPTVLVMGGSHGLGKVEPITRALSAAPFQTIVVTGHNRALHRALSRAYRGNRSVTVIGHSSSISMLMDAADVLVGKPGGLTSAEALAKGLATVIVAPLPGQEERNADFLTRHGAAIRCRAPEHLPRMLDALLSHPRRLETLRARALALGRPFAAADTAHRVLAQLRRQGARRRGFDDTSTNKIYY